MKQSLSVPKRIELIFDGLYLFSALAMGIVLIATSLPGLRQLWGAMALLLAAGDCFHLLPRMAAAYTGNTSRFQHPMGIGKLITSLSMTGFYLILWYIGLGLFSVTLPVQTTVILVLVALRVGLCLLPQNQWKQEHGSLTMGILRNIPFTLQGLLVMWLFARFAGQIPGLSWLWLAVLLSFLCYLPVVIWSSSHPKVGMLMLPKTCAYLWIIAMGFGL